MSKRGIRFSDFIRGKNTGYPGGWKVEMNRHKKSSKRAKKETSWLVLIINLFFFLTESY